MFINTVSHYIPEQRVPNEHFKNLNGLDDEWIFDRTGIRTRSKAAAGESPRLELEPTRTIGGNWRKSPAITILF